MNSAPPFARQNGLSVVRWRRILYRSFDGSISHFREYDFLHGFEKEKSNEPVIGYGDEVTNSLGLPCAVFSALSGFNADVGNCAVGNPCVKRAFDQYFHGGESIDITPLR